MLSKSIKPCNSSCKSCSFYQPEGRRGGMCQQLGVLVQARWKSCNLGIPAFTADYHGKEEIAILEKSFTLGCATPHPQDSCQVVDKNVTTCSIDPVEAQ